MQSVFAELLSKKPKVRKDEKYQRTYELPQLGTSLVIQEDPEGGVAGSVWDACYDLLNYIASESAFQSSNIHGKKVVELGAGTGIASIIFALLGAEVISTDRKEALEVLQLNMELNTDPSKHSIRVAELNWGEGKEEQYKPVDYLVVSECIYNLKYGDALLSSMTALSNPHTVILFAYAQRQPEEEDKFFAKVKEHFGSIEQLPTKEEKHKLLKISGKH
ncbi:Methyltransferase-like protein 21A [Balamuthia mandrillaris]